MLPYWLTEKHRDKSINWSNTDVNRTSWGNNPKINLLSKTILDWQKYLEHYYKVSFKWTHPLSIKKEQIIQIIQGRLGMAINDPIYCTKEGPPDHKAPYEGTISVCGCVFAHTPGNTVRLSRVLSRLLPLAPLPPPTPPPLDLLLPGNPEPRPFRKTSMKMMMKMLKGKEDN